VSSSARVDRDDRSVGDLLKDLTREVQRLARAEVELAKLEVREEISHAKEAAVGFGIAAVSGLLAVLLLSFAIAWGLAEVMPAGVAFLIVGVVYAIVAALVAMRTRRDAQSIDPVPEQTIATLKEDVRWARARSN
jgi:uncharacterized membrane protein YqjE